MRTWPGLAAIGAGLIHLGSAPGTPPAVLALLVLAGAAELLWGVAALARSAPPAPRAAAAGIAVVALLTAEALLLPPAVERTGTGLQLGVPVGALLAAGAFDVLVAVVLAAALAGGRLLPAQRPLPFLLSAGAAAAVVALVTIQGLAATSVGGGMPMRMH